MTTKLFEASIQEVFDTVDSVQEDKNTTVKISDIIENAGVISPEAVQITEIALEDIIKSLGIDTNSIAEEAARLPTAASRTALESLDNIFSKTLNYILELIRTVWEKIKYFFNGDFISKKRTEASVKKGKEVVEEAHELAATKSDAKDQMLAKLYEDIRNGNKEIDKAKNFGKKPTGVPTVFNISAIFAWTEKEHLDPNDFKAIYQFNKVLLDHVSTAYQRFSKYISDTQRDIDELIKTGQSKFNSLNDAKAGTIVGSVHSHLPFGNQSRSSLIQKIRENYSGQFDEASTSTIGPFINGNFVAVVVNSDSGKLDVLAFRYTNEDPRDVYYYDPTGYEGISTLIDIIDDFQNDFSKIRKEIKDSDARVNALLDRIKTAEKIKRKEGGRYGGSIRKNMDRAVENINLYSKILAKLTTDISRVQEVMENLLNRQSDKVSYVNKSLKKVTS